MGNLPARVRRASRACFAVVIVRDYNYRMPRRLPASILFLSLGLALLTLVPYLWANAAAGPGHVFAGFLLNPLDGATYLAKMRQGWEGNWLFTLPFTADPGPASFLFIYYLLLGHLARMLHLPLLVAFNAARVLAGFILLMTVWRFAEAISTNPRTRYLCWWTVAIGSGLGWLAALAGAFTADLWVAEFVPLLSIFSSAHFPLALALLLGIAIHIGLPPQPMTVKRGVVLWLMATALAILQPFALIPLAIAAGLWAAWARWRQSRFPDGSLVSLALLAAAASPWLAYDLFLTRTHPQLASWAAQNLTPTPPVWDVALSAGLVGMLALVATLRFILRRPIAETAVPAHQPFLIAWAVVNGVLLYAPLALQRRLMMGWFFPLTALAVPLLAQWIWKASHPWTRIVAAFALLIPSHLMLMVALAGGVLRHEPVLYLTRDEAAGLAFIAHTGTSHPLVVTSPEMSMFLPGWSGARVIYGHPMETPWAAEAERSLIAFFTSSSAEEQQAFLKRNKVDYVLFGPRERALGGALRLPLSEVFASGDVTIFSAAGMQ
jgi:hypothetical protein